MKKILFVEDDPLIARIYCQKLVETGFEVTVAADGLEAVKRLSELQPDLVVLDILIPKLNGLDVLRFIRQDQRLKSTCVIVFSNAFLNNLGEQLNALGVEEMLLKAAVTPGQLIEAISRVLEPSEAGSRVTQPVLQETNTEHCERENAAGFGKRIRHEFFEQIPATTKVLAQVSRDFIEAPDAAHKARHLESLARKVGFLTHMAGMAGCHRLSQLSSAFEALLFEIQEKPSILNQSTLRTIESTVPLLAECLGRAHIADEQCLSRTAILLVDDDAVSNRALLLALGHHRLTPTCVTDPFVALEKLRKNIYDIILLDINLPGMDGIQLCEQLRDIPMHQNTPVIFITSHLEFEPRARAILHRGDDLIAKPIVPIELTLKVIALSLRRRMAGLEAWPGLGNSKPAV